MKKKVLSVLLALMYIFLLVGCTTSENGDLSSENNEPAIENTQGDLDQIQLSMEDKLADFEEMYKIIEEGFPFLGVNKRTKNSDWLANKEAYEERIKATINDEEFINQMNIILRELYDYHTYLFTTTDEFEFYRDSSEAKYGDEFFNSITSKRYESLSSKSDNVSVYKNYKSQGDIILKDVAQDSIGYMFIPTFKPGTGSFEDISTNIETNINSMKK